MAVAYILYIMEGYKRDCVEYTDSVGRIVVFFFSEAIMKNAMKWVERKEKKKISTYR
jgi:hypothetical protein